MSEGPQNVRATGFTSTCDDEHYHHWSSYGCKICQQRFECDRVRSHCAAHLSPGILRGSAKTRPGAKPQELNKERYAHIGAPLSSRMFAQRVLQITTPQHHAKIQPSAHPPARTLFQHQREKCHGPSMRNGNNKKHALAWPLHGCTRVYRAEPKEH